MTDREISLVEFASGRQEFNPKEWVPHPYGRRVGIHPRGHPGYKNFRTGRVIPALPPGYVRDGDRILDETKRTSVTVTPESTSPVTDLRTNQSAEGPAAMVAGMPSSLFTPRKVRLALAALAEHHARSAGPTSRGIGAWSELLDIVHDNADSPTFRQEMPQYVAGASRLINMAPDMLRSVSPEELGHHWHYLLAATGTHRSTEHLQGRSLLHRALTLPDIPQSQRQPESSILRSVFLADGSPVTIPLSRDIHAMAKAAHGGNNRFAMSQLADALEEQGAPARVVENLRGPHVAVRGNWVLDAILGKR